MMRHLAHASLLCLVLTPSGYAADPASAQDPDRDLSVSFSARHDGGADPGYIFGTVTNSSNTAYPCVYVEFNLSTRFDMRQAGEESRRLGILGVEVKGVQPRSAKDFKKNLNYPAGVGLKSVSLCKESPASQRRNETVPSRRGTPPADTGDDSSDQATVRDHRTQVRDHRTGSAQDRGNERRVSQSKGSKEQEVQAHEILDLDTSGESGPSGSLSVSEVPLAAIGLTTAVCPEGAPELIGGGIGGAGIGATSCFSNWGEAVNFPLFSVRNNPAGPSGRGEVQCHIGKETALSGSCVCEAYCKPRDIYSSDQATVRDHRIGSAETEALEKEARAMEGELKELEGREWSPPPDALPD